MYARRVGLVSFWLLFLSTAALPAQKPGNSRPLLVCYGDSITAGYGLAAGQSYPDALQRDLDRSGFHFRVLNQGTSGATTKDAVAGVHAILALHPLIVVVEFGGNDGLRGLPLEQTRRNLDALLTELQNAHIRILLAGITLPPNYGGEYIQQFEQIYRDQAARHHTAIVPMLYRRTDRCPRHDSARWHSPHRQRF